MSERLESLRCLTDDAVIVQVNECVAHEREATALLLAALSELDVRRLYLGRGYGSLFDYCTRHLHLSERAAYGRIAAARLARRFPIILDLIADSRLSLTAVALLAKHLNEANHRALLEEATHKTAGEVEVMVARLAPKPDAPSSVRRVPARSLPGPTVAASESGDPPSRDRIGEPALDLRDSDAPPAAPPPPRAVPPPPRAVVKPLAPERFKVQFTISGEMREKLRAAQDLLRHSVPDGDLAAVFDRALNALLSELERKKMALVARPRGEPRAVKRGSRAIPAAVRRAVWSRDKGRCAFVGDDGRCRERAALELHHVKPFAAGGEATVENIELRCRAHNSHEADVFFGPPRGP